MNKEGFALIELLVVLVIVAILATIATPQLIKMIKRGYDAAALSDIRNIKNTLEGYYAENQRYPKGNWDEVKNDLGIDASHNVEVAYQGSADAYGIATQHIYGKKVFATSSGTEYIWYKFKPCKFSAPNSGLNAAGFESQGWNRGF